MRRTSRGEATRSKLLAAALSLFAREGLSGLTVHAVVKESGVSLGSLYHLFESADGLAAALYVECLTAWLRSIAAGLEGARSARATVLRIVRGYLDFSEREPVRARFVHASSYASFLPASAAVVARAIAAELAPIEARLAPHVAAGNIVALGPALLEVLVIGPAAEATRRWLAGDPRLAPELTRRVLPDRVWRSVALAPNARARATSSHEAPLTTKSGVSRTTGVTRSSSSSSTRRTSR